MSGSRVTRLAVLCCLLAAGLDIAVTGSLGLLFDIAFVLVCVFLAIAVRPADFFRAGILPPMLLLGLTTGLALVAQHTIAGAGDGFVQSLVSGLAHHSAALFAGYLATLAVLAVRHQVLGRTPAAPLRVYSNLEASPMPTRTTSADPDEKSTTVVGSDPHSPESITASSQ